MLSGGGGVLQALRRSNLRELSECEVVRMVCKLILSEGGL